MRAQHLRTASHKTDRRECLFAVVRQSIHESRRHRVSAVGSQQQSITVGGGLSDDGMPDRSGRALPILNRHRLTELG